MALRNYFNLVVRKLLRNILGFFEELQSDIDQRLAEPQGIKELLLFDRNVRGCFKHCFFPLLKGHL